MTPELRAHVDEFAADVAADALYIGKHRRDHNAVTVSEVWGRLSSASQVESLRLRLRRSVSRYTPTVSYDFPSPFLLKAPAVAAHTVTAGVPQAGRPPTAPGTAGPGLDSAQTRASTKDGGA